MTLNKILKLRIKESDKEKIREVANSLDMNMSSFVLKCVLDKVEEILKNENKEIDK